MGGQLLRHHAVGGEAGGQKACKADCNTSPLQSCLIPSADAPRCCSTLKRSVGQVHGRIACMSVRQPSEPRPDRHRIRFWKSPELMNRPLTAERCAANCPCVCGGSMVRVLCCRPLAALLSSSIEQFSSVWGGCQVLGHPFPPAPARRLPSCLPKSRHLPCVLQAHPSHGCCPCHTAAFGTFGRGRRCSCGAGHRCRYQQPCRHCQCAECQCVITLREL